MLRRGCLSVVLRAAAVVLVVVFACPTASGEVGPSSPDPRDYTLRLSDLDPGYGLGNDGSCRIDFEIWPTGDPDPTYLLNECNVDFRRMWMPKGRGSAEPRSVDSYAWVLPTAVDAAAQYQSETENARRPGTPQPVGDEARLTRRVLRERVLVFNRRSGKIGYRWQRANATAEIRWRSGRVLARIIVEGSARRVTRPARAVPATGQSGDWVGAADAGASIRAAAG